MRYYTLFILLFSLGGISAQSECDSLECLKVMIALNADGEAVVTPDMFMKNFDPDCDLEFVILDTLENVTTAYTESIDVDCNWLGLHTIKVREADTLNNCTDLLNVIDPLNACISDNEELHNETSIFVSGHFLHIIGYEESEANISIHDLQGRPLCNKNTGYRGATYDLSFLRPSQMYIITVETATSREVIKVYKR